MDSDDDDSLFVELDDDDDISTIPIETIFGIKTRNCIYFVQFQKNTDNREYFLTLKICDADDDGDDDELLTWQSLFLSATPLLDKLIQILIDLPAKFARMFENLNDDEDEIDLTAIDVTCFLELLQEGVDNNYSQSIINTLIQLNREYLTVIRSFENLSVTQNELFDFFNRIQPVFEACHIFLTFAHFQLIHLERFQIFTNDLVQKLTQCIFDFRRMECNLRGMFVNCVF
jgi:hypothetical protein